MTAAPELESPPRPPPPGRRLPVRLLLAATLVVAILLAAGLAVLVTRDGGGPSGDRSPGGSGAPGESGPVATDAASAASAFLDGYVDPDGRVVRRDQGGDTVSEGQAYAMLVSAGTGQEDTFRSVWGWTTANLQRPDGLLSWQWSKGSVIDAESASDADLDAARALVLAGTKFGDASLTSAGAAMGRAVLEHETVTTDAGLVLAAGTWTAGTDPTAFNPSYASPAATALLAEATPDPRWAKLDAGNRVAVDALLARSPLPPDWAQIHGDGHLDAMPGPAGGGPDVRFGYDAMRVAPRFAESCTAADVALAARLLPALGNEADGSAVLDLGGKPISDDKHPLAAISFAAASAASGDQAAAGAALRQAGQLQGDSATYYGAAWTALGWLALTTDDLGGCPPATGAASASSASASGGGGGGSVGSAAPASGAVSAVPGVSGRHALPARSGPTPVSVTLPSIGTRSKLDHLALAADGTLAAPKEWQVAGWYAGGPAPGEQGPAVIAGHVDSRQGPAIFVDLHRLAAGDPVKVAMSDGSTVSFTVDRTERVPKNGFPTDQVYGPTPDAQLRLITCDGDFDDATGHYVDNLVVFATRT